MSGVSRREVERVLDAVAGLVRGGAVFSADANAPAWWCNGTEVAHFDGDLLDLRLGRKAIAELRRSGVAIGSSSGAGPIRRRTPSSDWVEVAVTTAADLDLLRDLATRAAAAHAPPPGVPPKPPPSGPDLERRRRWH